MMYILWWFRIA